MNERTMCERINSPSSKASQTVTAIPSRTRSSPKAGIIQVRGTQFNGRMSKPALSVKNNPMTVRTAKVLLNRERCTKEAISATQTNRAEIAINENHKLSRAEIKVGSTDSIQLRIASS